LGGISVNGTDRTIHFVADPGLTFLLQYSDSLTGSSWTGLDTAAEISPGTYEVHDLAPTNTTRYYRLKKQ
jgi:hypothetical protein